MANFVARKVWHCRCKICAHTQVYIDSEHKPGQCPRCNIRSDQVKFVTVQSEGDPKTHNTVHWGCKWCSSHGIMWLDKKRSNLQNCPVCGHGNDGGVWTQKTNPEGNCATIWPTVDGVTRPKIRMSLTKKKFRCPHCNQTHQYLMKIPTHCHRCGEVLEVNTYDQNQNTTT